jgi:sugar phosphate isomerase/epimerase
VWDFYRRGRRFPRFARVAESAKLGAMAFLRCLSSLGCPEFSLGETLAVAAKHGVGGVELRALGGTVELAGYLAKEFGSPEELAEKLRGECVRVVAFNTSMKLVGGSTAEREQLIDIVPWAEALGVRWLRVFDGGKTADAGELAHAVETLRWWREERAARSWGVDWMIETHDSLFTAAAIGRLLAVVPEAAILWDSHHTWKKGGEDPLVTWRAVRGSVVHVHVKDSVSVPSARHPFTYVLPGAGEFPMAPLVAELKAAEFSGPVSLEWERMWHPYLPPLDEALAVAAARGWW